MTSNRLGIGSAVTLNGIVTFFFFFFGGGTEEFRSFVS